MIRRRAGAVVRQVDTQRMAKDGRRIDVSISMSPIRDDAGRIVGAAAFTRDISMRIAAEERLRRSEAQLADAQQLAALGSWQWDVVSNELTWSPELYRILGYDPDRFTASSEGYFDAIHPSDRLQAEAAAGDALAGGPPLNHECRAVRPDGIERVIHARGRTIKDDAGQVVRMVGSVQDITGLAQTRQRLEQANRQNEALLNSAADGIYGLDLEGRITFVNPAATALTGHAVEEALGRRHHELVHHTREDGSPYPLEANGGEELLVLLAEQTLEGALVVCERMREAVQALGLAHAENEAGVVTISIGAAECPKGARTDSTDAIRRADRALYAAKAQGRNLVIADR